MSVTVHHGDSREVLPTLADGSIDSVVCDPPYSLVSIVKRFGSANAAPAKDRDGLYKRASAGFMGKQWDTGEVAFDPAFWIEVMRVMKPGAHLIAFSGTRTYHRLACAIEDAGFEIRDQLAFMYGCGFPKSHDVSKAIDRAAGAERDLTRQGVVQRDGYGGDWDTGSSETRPRYDNPATDAARQWQGWGTALKPAWEPIVLARKPLIGTVAATVQRHGTGALNIDGCRVGTDDTRSLTSKTALGVMNDDNWRPREVVAGSECGRWPANVIHDGSDEVLKAFEAYGEKPGAVSNGRREGGDNYFPGKGPMPQISGRADTGTAARFFYSAKADADDRLGSKHPTVKPVDLMAYLCRLVTPPGGTVLDPFAGSGTTGMACLREGFDCILIEREAEYVEDIHRRIAHVKGDDTPLFNGSAA